MAASKDAAASKPQPAPSQGRRMPRARSAGDAAAGATAEGLEQERVVQSSPRAPELRVSQATLEAPEHVVLMVNGLFGNADNWRVVQRNLAQLQQASRLLMLASTVNLRMQTFEGIDACGERLAEEVLDCIRGQPSLRYISVMGHSMGGLIARHAIGRLYSRETGLVAGLQPRHFITLATPHLGCGGEGPAQVPFIGWTADVPLVGPLATRALQAAADPVASLLLGRTGQQFFLVDGAGEGEGAGAGAPLLLRLAQDSDDGPFLSALRAFATRTCYANSSGDHIVGWANSSIRHPTELPDLGDTSAARGVVREDPLEAGFSPGVAGAQRGQTREAASVPLARSGSRELQQAVAGAEATVGSSGSVLRVLGALQGLPWSRVDACFRGTNFPYFAHNLIQVTRQWLNWEGEPVVQHLAQRFAALEAALGAAEAGAGAGSR